MCVPIGSACDCPTDRRYCHDAGCRRSDGSMSTDPPKKHTSDVGMPIDVDDCGGLCDWKGRRYSNFGRFCGSGGGELEVDYMEGRSGEGSAQPGRALEAWVAFYGGRELRDASDARHVRLAPPLCRARSELGRLRQQWGGRRCWAAIVILCSVHNPSGSSDHVPWIASSPNGMEMQSTILLWTGKHGRPNVTLVPNGWT